MSLCKNIVVAVVSVLAGLLLCFGSYGQRYSFHNLSVDAGLIQSQAMCLAQDKTGNLWVGTLGGLSRYDGRTFTNYSVRNGLLSNMINAVASDTAGRIWIGTRKGLSLYDGKKFQHFALQHELERSTNISQQIFVVKDTTWWRAAGDVYYVSGGKIKYQVTPHEGKAVTALLAERSHLWVAKDDTIYHYSGGKWDSVGFPVAPGAHGPSVNRMFRDKNQVIWLATNSGLYFIDGKIIMPYMIGGQPLNYFSVLSITQDKAGALWLGTNTGVVKLLNNSMVLYNKRNGLSDNTVYDIITDSEHNIWMASDGQGIFRFSGTSFTGLDESMGLPSAQVMAIASNKRDSLFLGTYDAGLFVFKDGKIIPRSFPSNPVPSITSLCYSHNQKLWIGTRGRGLFEYDHEIFRQYSAPEHGFPSNTIMRLYEDPDNRLWIGFTNGVIVYEQDTFRTIAVPKVQVVSFLSIGKDSILIATDKNGLLLYHDGAVYDFKTRTIADSSAIECFILKGSELWLGSSDNGVIRCDLHTRKASVINKSNGLRSDFVYNIIEDNDGNVWVGTGYGIHKINVADGTPHVTFYGKEQGVTGMESNINAVLKLKDGGIWFGTTNGAIHYQPHSEVAASAPASIVLQSVKLAGESAIDPSYYDSTDNWYGVPYHLMLPFKKNNISFTFQAITLSGAEQVLYRYRMDGLEAPWSEWSATNSVTYSALPPGKYTFRAECTGASGGKNSQFAYAFEIITPFHKTGWFRMLVLGACILMGIFLQYIYNHRKQRRQKLRARLRAEEQAKIRLRTAEDFHDEIGNKLTRINVLANVLKNKITPTPDVTRILSQIEENAGLLYGGTRDILWSLKPSNDNLYEILQRIHDFGGELFEDTNITFTFGGTTEKWRNYRLPMDTSRNLIMIFKEAMNNALKYSKAQNVTLDVTLKGRDVLVMVLRDDGVGFEPKTLTGGNGINNMQIRAARLNGRLYIDSRHGKGTILTLTFKIPRNR